MDAIEELLTRGVDTVYPTKTELEKVLRSGKKLKIYQGFDPTGTQLHVGHMVGFRKLAQWQKLGHKVVFLIGTGTGLAGDPSGKLKSRDKFLTEDELKQNAKDYVMQAGKLVNFSGENPIEIAYNGDWLNKLTLKDILDIAGHFSLQQLAERDLFQERIKKGESVNLREFLYPLLQGYDSVAISTDVELGGSDQMFNMLAGRNLVKEMQGREKYVMTTPLLTDSEGRKIGKTEGNVIGLTDQPADLFGKIMSLSDDVIVKGMEYLTDIPMEEIKKIEKNLSEGAHPVPFKKRLAFEIVKQLNDENAATEAQKEFERVVQGKEMPTEIKEYKYPKFESLGKINIIDLLEGSGFVESRSEAKRLIEGKAIKVDGKTIEEVSSYIESKNGIVVQIGKRKFFRIVSS